MKKVFLFAAVVLAVISAFIGCRKDTIEFGQGWNADPVFLQRGTWKTCTRMGIINFMMRKCLATELIGSVGHWK